MKRNAAFTTVLVLLAASATVARAADGLRAFPGAEGFGAISVGGRGGQVITVTSLDARGPGSLQEACGAEGPRIDSDQDGMPDSWENAHGLNDTDGSDHLQTMTSGYTTIEEYRNELAAQRVR